MADEADLQKFLQENKIDPAAIMAAAKPDKDSAIKAKHMAVLEARLNAYPYSAEDLYQMKVANHSSFAKHTMQGCYKKCVEREDVPFLTVPEGLCFRNCITKMAVFMPTLRENMENTQASHLAQQYSDHVMPASADPWDKTAQRLLNKYVGGEEQVWNWKCFLAETAKKTSLKNLPLKAKIITRGCWVRSRETRSGETWLKEGWLQNNSQVFKPKEN